MSGHMISRSEQLLGQRRLTFALALNPLAAGFTVGPIIYLLALYYGASDFQMGLLYAALWISGITSILSPRWLGGMQTTRIIARFWWVRACVCLGYVLLPFLISPTIKVWWIVILYYGFLIARSFGMVAFFPVIKALTRPRELVSINARMTGLWFAGSLVASAMVFVVLRLTEWWAMQEAGFISMLLLGALLNMGTAALFDRIPSTGRQPYTRTRAIFQSMADVAKNGSYRETAILLALLLPMALMTNYQYNYFRKVLLVSESVIFMMTLLALSGAFVMTMCQRIIGSRIPANMQMFGVHALLVCISLNWCAIELWPHAWRPWMAGGLFVLTGMMLAMSFTVTNCLQAERLPKSGGVQIAAVYQFIGVIASLLGLGLSQLALFAADWLPMPGGHGYVYVFGLWTVLSSAICGVSLAIRARPLAELSKVVSVFSPANLFVIFKTHAAGKEDRQHTRLRVMESLMAQQTPTSRQLLMESVTSPEIRRRYSAYRTLCEAPLPQAFEPVLREACSDQSPLKYDAITCLGFMDNPAAIRHLVPMLEHDDLRTRAVTCKSLLRLGAEMSDQRLLQLYEQLQNTHDRLQILFGLIPGPNVGLVMELFSREMALEPDPYWLVTLLENVADALGDRTLMLELMESYQEDASAAINELLAELAGRKIKPAVIKDLQQAIRQNDLNRLNQRLRDQPQAPSAHAYNLLSAVGLLGLWLIQLQDQNQNNPATWHESKA